MQICGLFTDIAKVIEHGLSESPIFIGQLLTTVNKEKAGEAHAPHRPGPSTCGIEAIQLKRTALETWTTSFRLSMRSTLSTIGANSFGFG